jgi:hypothetical protein
MCMHSAPFHSSTRAPTSCALCLLSSVLSVLPCPALYTLHHSKTAAFSFIPLYTTRWLRLLHASNRPAKCSNTGSMHNGIYVSACRHLLDSRAVHTVLFPAPAQLAESLAEHNAGAPGCARMPVCSAAEQNPVTQNALAGTHCNNIDLQAGWCELCKAPAPACVGAAAQPRLTDDKTGEPLAGFGIPQQPAITGNEIDVLPVQFLVVTDRL